MSGKAKVVAALVACCLVVGAQGGVIQTIPFFSGDTTPGNETYLAKEGPKMGVVTEAQFRALYSDFIVNYATSPSYRLASILEDTGPYTGTNPNWIAQSIPNSDAKWVSTRVDGGTEDYKGPGGVTSYTEDIESGLYAIKIINNSGHNAALVCLTFAADNWLGWPTAAEMASNPNYNDQDRAITGFEGTPMIFVNDVAYNMSYDLRDFSGGLADGLCYFVFTNVTLQDGENWIFINVANGGTGGPHGVIFAGEVQIIPEPITMSLLALGGLAMLRRRKR